MMVGTASFASARGTGIVSIGPALNEAFAFQVFQNACYRGLG